MLDWRRRLTARCSYDQPRTLVCFVYNGYPCFVDGRRTALGLTSLGLRPSPPPRGGPEANIFQRDLVLTYAGIQLHHTCRFILLEVSVSTSEPDSIPLAGLW